MWGRPWGVGDKSSVDNTKKKHLTKRVLELFEIDWNEKDVVTQSGGNNKHNSRKQKFYVKKTK